MTHVFEGAGPGPQTSDGCSVELYRDLPYLGELDDILGELRNGSHALELGCGTGRLTRLLLGKGLSVTGVDNSAEMLAAMPHEAASVLCEIEHLSLAGRFDVAILASCLVNHPDPSTRKSFLAAARRHLKPGARLFVQRHDPNWLQNASAGDVSQRGETSITVETVARSGNKVSMKIRYDRPQGTWWHSFGAVVLDEQATEAALTDAGFGQTSWHGHTRRWISASACR